MENEVMNVILSRRSIRSYTEEPVTAAEIQVLKDAALAAPSAMNRQPWHFTFCANKALLQKINEAGQAQASAESADKRGRYVDPNYDVFYKAPLVIFVSAEPDGFFTMLDCGIATQNIVLAAESLGLGSVILGLPRFAFQSPCGDELRAALHFPAGQDFAIAIAIGHAAATKDAHEIKPNRVDDVL